MRYLVFLLAVLFLVGCKKKEEDNLPVVRSETPLRKDATLSFVAPDGSVVRQIGVEIAATPQARETGLMYRRALTFDEGMLFVFEQPDSLTFWMHNTPTPLDIMFVRPDSTILNIAERTTPMSDNTVAATGLARFVVETRAGFAATYGITPGMKVRW